MNVNPISQNQKFGGRVIVNGTINKQQSYLFNLHRPVLEKMIESHPFDLLISQSKSHKTINLKTSIDDACAAVVPKNKQNYEQAAEIVISNGIQKHKIKDMKQKATQLFNLQKISMGAILTGQFKNARWAEKQYAELAVENFDIAKKMPKVNTVGVPLQIFGKALINGIGYRIYRAFTPKSPAEKQLAKMAKSYEKELKAENKKRETVNIILPRMF